MAANTTDHVQIALDSQLEAAVYAADRALTKRLLAAGASPHARSYANRTLLHFAREPSAVNILLKHGADIEARDHSGLTPLNLFVRDLHVDLARLLIELGADIQTRDDQGRTPLAYCILSHNRDTLRDLAAAGADLDAPIQSTIRPLHLAAAQGRDDLFFDLIEAGARAPKRTLNLCASIARRDNHTELAERIQAFIEARDLSRGIRNPINKNRPTRRI